jgi:hypothetical protein
MGIIWIRIKTRVKIKTIIIVKTNVQKYQEILIRLKNNNEIEIKRHPKHPNRIEIKIIIIIIIVRTVETELVILKIIDTLKTKLK